MSMLPAGTADSLYPHHARKVVMTEHRYCCEPGQDGAGW